MATLSFNEIRSLMVIAALSLLFASGSSSSIGSSQNSAQADTASGILHAKGLRYNTHLHLQLEFPTIVCCYERAMSIDCSSNNNATCLRTAGDTRGPGHAGATSASVEPSSIIFVEPLQYVCVEQHDYAGECAQRLRHL
jgi:hypothetical protein